MTVFLRRGDNFPDSRGLVSLEVYLDAALWKAKMNRLTPSVPRHQFTGMCNSRFCKGRPGGFSVFQGEEHFVKTDQQVGIRLWLRLRLRAFGTQSPSELNFVFIRYKQIPNAPLRQR